MSLQRAERIQGSKVLVIGAGAREHAIAYALATSPSVREVTVAPGNPGMERDHIHTTSIGIQNHAALVEFARENAYDWVFIGPEVPLIHGLTDDLEAAGIAVFGPSRQAAQIEGSKDFAKQLMARHHIPTAHYRTFDEFESAKQYVQRIGAPIVIKADGLAAGKGVTVAMSVDEALRALEDIFLDHRFGAAGAKVVVEEFLQGQEFSLMSFVRGRKFWTMPLAQDHKRAYDGDKGPNTGGMGSYCPVPQISQEMIQASIDTIIRPTVEAMDDEGMPFTGVLYAGLIATEQGPKVIEFNARFGDPETEVILPRLRSDFGAAITAMLNDEEPTLDWAQEGITLGVVLASQGYPDDVHAGSRVPDIATDEQSHVFYAGVKLDTEHQLVASSGRVLVLETTAPDVAQAQQRIYAQLDALHAEGFFYRHDIGAKALTVQQ